KEDNMVKYLEIVKSLVSGFTTFSISQVSRSRNKKADALSKITSTSFAHLSKQVLVEVLEKIHRGEGNSNGDRGRRTDLDDTVSGLLKKRSSPRDKKEARKLRLKARQYELIEGILYRRSFLTPWLRCVGPLQAEYVIRDIHEGSCSMHAGPRSVVAKATRLGPFFGKTKEGQIFNSHHGLLHEVDRSEGSGNNYWRTVDVVNNDEELRLNLDLLEERRERTAICEAKVKSKMTKYYNARVRGIAFKP
nr:reverse transcriptase domain-containing protein [Tanacetum cinerariifolium]